MKVKLSLTIDDKLITEVRKFAKANKRSISQIVSEKLSAFIDESTTNKEPFSKRAAGIVKGAKFKNLDKLRRAYLAEEYNQKQI